MRNRWRHQIVNIENAGLKAFQEGVPAALNPYLDGYRNQNGAGGQLQRQRRLAWDRGWEIGQRRAQEPLDSDP